MKELCQSIYNSMELGLQRMKALYLFLLISAITCSCHCWSIGDCVFVSGDIYFNISYKAKSSDTANPEKASVAKVSIPSDGITIGGACEDVEKGQAANLELKWKGFDFLILFVKETGNDHWYAQKVRLSYNESELLDAVNPTSVIVKTNNEEKLFLTRLTHFYQCNSSDTHPLYRFESEKVTTENLVNMTTSNLVVKPYKSLKKPEQCTMDEVTVKPTKKPTTKPHPHTDPKPTPYPGPSGSRVAWTCTIVSLLIICVCGILIYHNRMRDGLPDYATMG